MDDFGPGNGVSGEFVSEPYPARSAVGMCDLAMEFTIDFGVVAALSGLLRPPERSGRWLNERSKGTREAASPTYLGARAVDGRR